MNMEAIQIEYGNQNRRYGNHIWKWVIKKDGTPREQVIEWALENLKRAEHEKTEYQRLYRVPSSFEQTMELVCGGFYYLTERNDKEWEYTVEQEYID